MPRRKNNKNQTNRKKKAKPPQASRKQQYRAKQRASWAVFLGKLLLFFVPAALATWWVVDLVLRSGEELDLLVLDPKSHQIEPEELKRAKVWNCRTYGGAMKDGMFVLPEKIRFGGPDRNALVIFNDLLGSARELKSKATNPSESGDLTPCFFIPANAEEHQTHQFFGIPDAETDQHQAQWVTASDYLQDLIGQLAKQTSAPPAGDKKVLLVLDVDHPDLAGRLPPQSNRFMGLLIQQWASISQQLENDFPNFDIYLWLSHAQGQKSYFDSDPEHVESFFKHRFERGFTGDVFLEIPDQRREVLYSDMKNYLGRRVTRDAATHNLVQTPVFLEPKGSDIDFKLLRFRNPKQVGVTKLAKLFGYERREPAPAELNQLWNDFQNAKRKYRWELENPLAIQQINTLLLQMERLWYAGRVNSEMFTSLRNQANDLIAPRTSITQVEHSLYDAAAQANREGQSLRQPQLQLAWLEPDQDLSSLPEEQRKEAEQARQQQAQALTKWREENTRWPAAMAVWNFILDDSLGIDRSLILRALKILPPGCAVANSNSNSGSKVEFNEIAFLRRIANELVWPKKSDNAHVAFVSSVQKSLKLRDQSNRFAAGLAPSLSRYFRQRFETLESKRRTIEDRFFAHDNLGQLREESDALSAEYDQLTSAYQSFENRLEAGQATLVNASHEFRYRIESAASSNQEMDADWVDPFWTEVESLSQQPLTYFETHDPPVVGQLAAAPFEGVETGRAAAPAIDLSRFQDNLGVADGNLLGRRLLLWPDLDSETRRKLHQGLAKQKVSLVESDKVAIDAGADQAITKSDTPSIPPTPLSSDLLEKINQVRPMFPSQTSFEFSDDVTNLLQIASQANRFNLFDAIDPTDKLAKFINRFHARKSNLDFQRVAMDLWGSPTSGRAGSKPYVLSALMMHQKIVRDKLDQLRKDSGDRRLETLRLEISEIWNKEVDAGRSWSQRLSQVEQFSTAFNKWRSRPTTSSSVNKPLMSAYDTELELDNALLFSLRSNPSTYGKVETSEVRRMEDRIRLDTPESLQYGDRLTVYLRGYQQVLAVPVRPSRSSRNVFVDLGKTIGIEGTQIQINRSADDPVIGEISLLLDCSGSMDNRMDLAKKYVSDFLKATASRSDLKISLYAVGATIRHNANGDLVGTPPNLSSWFRINQNDDVWKYVNNHNQLDKNTLPGFLKAIGQLKAFGETPLVAGLDLALADAANRPRLLVLLTDGFEFTKLDGEKYPTKFDSTRYRRVKSQLKDPESRLVIFNMLPIDINSIINANEQEKSKALKEWFGNVPSFQKGQPENPAETINRIQKINELTDARYRAIGDGKRFDSLKGFLKGVLPQLYIDRDPPFVEKAKPVQLGSKLLRTIRTPPTDRPDDWSLELKFRTGSGIDIFDKEKVTWKTDQKSYGNELLKYEYNPVQDSLTLVTEWSSGSDHQSIEAAGRPLRIVQGGIRSDKLFYLVASKDESQLTPAPAMTWLELTNDDAITYLVQDYNLRQQKQSNVHPIEFPEIESILVDRSLAGRGSPFRVVLKWLDSFAADFWTTVDLAEIESKNSVANQNKATATLTPERFSEISSLFQGQKTFNGIEVLLRYQNVSIDALQIQIRIQRSKDASGRRQPILDHWLVQLLSADGTELHRQCRLKSKREYVLENDGNGNESLVAMVHHFEIDRSAFEKYGAKLGFARLDDIAEKYDNLPQVSFPESLKAR